MKKINFSFAILLALFIHIIISDAIIYIFGTRYIVSNIVSLVFDIVLIAVLIKKKIIIIKSLFNKWDLIFLVIIFCVMLLLIIFPDEFWDSYSYHIYMQKYAFNDKVTGDFFPGRTLTSFVFPLVDRLFGMFRFTLGFRLGALPSFLIIIVMFYEIKKILKYILNNDIKESYLSIFSMLPICTFIILQQMGTYYIDNFSIVILLEFVYNFLKYRNNVFEDKINIYYLAFIIGIVACIKFTNIIYIVLPFIYMVIRDIKNIKKLKWYDYLLLVITCILPFIIYVLDAIIQTGSPVFPYYNAIFKSQYFEETNWLDKRYGPKGIIQFLIWPVYIIFNPNKAYEVGKTDLLFAFGYFMIITCILYFLYSHFIKKKKINKTNIAYILLLLYLYLVWEKFIIGYTRYAGIICVLIMIFLIKIIMKLIEQKKIIAILLIAGMIVLSSYQGVNEFLKFSNLHKYISAIKDNDENSKKMIKYNINILGKDKENVKYDIDGIWGVIDDDSAMPSMLNVNDKLVQLENGTKVGNSKSSQDIYWNNVLNNNIFVPLYSFKLDEKLDMLDKYNFKIVEIKQVLNNVPYLMDKSILWIVKIEYTKDKVNNKEIFNELIGNNSI